jgi:hypothetical protein
MKTPPFLLLAALLFWGWQSHLLLYGALAGLVLEAARICKPRWDLEDGDFLRIWSLCTLVLVALGAYVFTTNSEGGGLSGMFQGVAGLRNATASSSAATTSVLRWLPLIFFLFIGAQVYNVRPTVPLASMSLVLRLRRRRGDTGLAGRYVDLSHAYFMLCIFSAGVHSNQATLTYFCGQSVLILWALWALRSGRFTGKAWAGSLVVILVLGLAGLAGIGRLELAVQTFDARMFARILRSRTDPFQSTTAIGQIGDLKLSPRIVIRLEPAKVGVVPAYLREASYWTYYPGNQIWKATTSSNSFEELSRVSPKDDTWILVPGKTNQFAVSIATYLNGHARGENGDSVPEGLLPLPSGCGRLENLPAFNLKMNRSGVVMADGPGLVIFDARYGPGATFDSPPDPSTNQFDLSVPTNEVPALDQVIAEINLTNASDLDKRLAVETFFAQKFTYTTWQGPQKRRTPAASPLTRFLLASRSGHCEYFATATVLLLRKLGIPARYAVGYSVHEVSGTGYVVRERDAHAWCLVWNRETQAWEDFDTTPAAWIAIEGRQGSVFDALSDLRSWLVFQFEKILWRESHLQQYILWTFMPVILVLLYYIIFQRRSRDRTAKKTGADATVLWPGHDSAFYRLEKSLAARGLPRPPQEALSAWLDRVLAEPALAGMRDPLQHLLQLHYRHRFDPQGLNADQKRSLIQNTNAILRALAQTKPGKQVHTETTAG